MSQKNVSVSMDRLFAWHSAAKSVVMFPGMEAKMGKEPYRDLCRMVLELEAAIGVVKEDQGFNG